MKFDIVIGNPPYQSVTSSDANRQGGLWWKFLKEAMNNSKGYIGFVTPKSIFSGGGFGTDTHKVTNIINRGFGFTHIWTDVSSHFKVGIQTTAFILEKGYTGKTLLVDRNEEIIVTKDAPLPFHLTKTNYDIVKKCTNGRDEWWPFKEVVSPDNNEYVVSINTGRFKQYKKLYVGVQRNNPHSYRGNENQCTGMIIPRNQVSNYKSIFNSKLFSYMYYIMGGEDAQGHTGILQSLPYVDPSKVYTDKQLYKMFNLNQEETDQIDS